VQPEIEMIPLSSKTGEGFDAWLEWLELGVQRASARLEDTIAALQRRIRALERELAGRVTSA